MKKIINLTDISYSYNKKDNVIKNINLEIAEKSFSCILGPSGCGKSTLLKIIASMIQPDSGSLSINSKTVNTADPDRVIVFQDDNQLFPWLTVIDNISFPMKIMNMDNIRSHSIELLKKVHLDGYENYYPCQLSGGMKKRAIIARALSSSPDILLMDEPFSSLDIQTRTSLHKLIYNIWQNSGITVVFVTHDIDEALTLSSDITIMKNDGSYSTIRENSFSGNFDYPNRDFFTKRRELIDMIDIPDDINNQF